MPVAPIPFATKTICWPRFACVISPFKLRRVEKGAKLNPFPRITDSFLAITDISVRKGLRFVPKVLDFFWFSVRSVGVWCSSQSATSFPPQRDLLDPIFMSTAFASPRRFGSSLPIRDSRGFCADDAIRCGLKALVAHSYGSRAMSSLSHCV